MKVRLSGTPSSLRACADFPRDSSTDFRATSDPIASPSGRVWLRSTNRSCAETISPIPAAVIDWPMDGWNVQREGADCLRETQERKKNVPASERGDLWAKGPPRFQHRLTLDPDPDRGARHFLFHPAVNTDSPQDTHLVQPTSQEFGLSK